LAYTHNHSIAWVIDPQQDEPIAKLSIGGEESIGFDWTPDGSSFLSWSAHRVRLSLISLSLSLCSISVTDGDEMRIDFTVENFNLLTFATTRVDEIYPIP